IRVAREKVRASVDAHRRADTDGAHHERHARGHVLDRLESRLAARERVVIERIEPDVERLEVRYFLFELPAFCFNLHVRDLDPLESRADDAQRKLMLASELG